MKKLKIVSLFLLISMVLSVGIVFADSEDVSSNLLIASNPYASDSIKVLLNDQMIDFTDENGNVVEPQIINSRTMVPMRKIFEVFGAEVSWNGETREVTATTQNKSLKLQIDNTTASVITDENTENITLDSAPVIIEGRTLVPVRFIAESLELKVGWDAETRTVIILDKSFIMNRLEKEAPELLELLNTDSSVVLTEEATISGIGNIKYTNSVEKSSNTNLKVNIDGKMKQNESAVSADLTIKTTGSGLLYNEIKKIKREKITFNVVLDKNNLTEYIKSSLLEEKAGSKWVAIDFGENMNNVGLSSNISTEDLINQIIDSLELTTNTYYEINEYIDLICELFGSKHLTVTGRTTRTYTYEISAEELMKLFGKTESDIIEGMDDIDTLSAKLKVTMKVEDNVITSSDIVIEGTLVSNHETTNFDLKLNSKVTSKNKKVTITMPIAKEVVSVE